MDGVNHMNGMFVLGIGISFNVLIVLAIASIIFFIITFMMKSDKENNSQTKFHRMLIGIFGILAIVVLSASFMIDNTEWQNEVNKKKAIEKAYNKISEDEDSSYNKYQSEQFGTLIDR